MQKDEFIKGIENMVDPTNSATISYMQQYMKFVPKKLQSKIIESGAKRNNYMGFIVDPYPIFLCYEIKDIEGAKKLIDQDYELIKTKIFTDDMYAKYYIIIGAFNVRTSAFYGTRLETYVIARNKKTNLLSWVIIDYDTNTISFDPTKGLSPKNTKECILTTTYNQDLITKIQSEKHILEVNAKLKTTNTKNLDQKLWLEGNLSVAYGKELNSGNTQGFSILFNALEVACAEEIVDFEIINNNWYSDLINECEHVITFKYAQHFLSDAPGHYSCINNEQEMENKIKQIDFKTINNYSSDSIQTMLFKGQIIPYIIIILLVLLIIITYIFN